MSPNGAGFIVKSRAPGLANYPHARKAGGMFYVSGISSRNPDNSSWRGEFVDLELIRSVLSSIEIYRLLLERIKLKTGVA